MRRTLLAAAVGAALVLGSLAWADGPQLQGSVGRSFVISLRDAAGAPVAHLDPGAYQLQVSDLSDEHSFHLQGPGSVDAGTDVEGSGTKTFSLTLVDGVYSSSVTPTRRGCTGRSRWAARRSRRRPSRSSWR